MLAPVPIESSSEYFRWLAFRLFVDPSTQECAMIGRQEADANHARYRPLHDSEGLRSITPKS